MNKNTKQLRTYSKVIYFASEMAQTIKIKRCGSKIPQTDTSKIPQLLHFESEICISNRSNLHLQILSSFIISIIIIIISIIIIR